MMQSTVNKVLKWTLVLLIMCFSQAYADKQSTAILFVGNSLTYYNAMPSMVRSLAGVPDSGELTIEMFAQGGALVREHLNAGAVAREINQHHYDYVVLQELGGFPLCPATFRGCTDSPSAINEMIALIKHANSRVILYGTWAPSDIQRKLSKKMKEIARSNDVVLADVGKALSKIKDKEFASKMLLPNGHPTPLGSWLASMVIYKAIYGSIPRSAPAIPCGFDWTGQADPSLSLLSLASTQNAKANRCHPIGESDYKLLFDVVSRIE